MNVVIMWNKKSSIFLNGFYKACKHLHCNKIDTAFCNISIPYIYIDNKGMEDEFNL